MRHKEPASSAKNMALPNLTSDLGQHIMLDMSLSHSRSLPYMFHVSAWTNLDILRNCSVLFKLQREADIYSHRCARTLGASQVAREQSQSAQNKISLWDPAHQRHTSPYNPLPSFHRTMFLNFKNSWKCKPCH